MTIKSANAQKTCEDILREEIRCNTENNVWPSVNIVAERLLERGNELIAGYQEICQKLQDHPYAINGFLDSVLSSPAIWSSDSISKERNAREKLIAINKKIVSLSQGLAGLLDERSALSNDSAFSSSTHYHVCDVIEESGEDNVLFRMWVKDDLSNLCSQYSLKYWPSIGDFMRVLSSDASNASIEASDPVTAAATKSQRASKADSVRALMAFLDSQKSENGGRIPNDFKPTDKTLASFINCALDFDADELVGEDYVKRLRQRDSELMP